MPLGKAAGRGAWSHSSPGETRFEVTPSQLCPVLLCAGSCLVKEQGHGDIDECIVLYSH